VRFKPHRLLLGAVAALLGGAALQSFESHSAAPAARLTGRALMGGFAPLAADGFWLKANLAWERHDAAETRRLIGLAVAADPQTSYFWLNGARMLAYDLPVWRLEAERNAPVAVRRKWRQAAAADALRLLTRGSAWHGNSAGLQLEMANISLYGLGDPQLAAEYYAQAAEQPDAPPYAARLAARLRDAEQ